MGWPSRRPSSACWPGCSAPAVAASRSITSSGTGCLPGSGTGESPSLSFSLKALRCALSYSPPSRSRSRSHPHPHSHHYRNRATLSLIKAAEISDCIKDCLLAAITLWKHTSSSVHQGCKLTLSPRWAWYVQLGAACCANGQHPRPLPSPCSVPVQAAQAVLEEELPLTLPPTQDFKPSGRPESPLAKITDWVQTTDPSTGVFPSPMPHLVQIHNRIPPRQLCADQDQESEIQALD